MRISDWSSDVCSSDLLAVSAWSNASHANCNRCRWCASIAKSSFTRRHQFFIVSLRWLGGSIFLIIGSSAIYGDGYLLAGFRGALDFKYPGRSLAGRLSTFEPAPVG